MKSPPTRRQSIPQLVALFLALAASAAPGQGPVAAASPTPGGTAGNPGKGPMPVRASLQIEAASARYRLTDTTALFLKGFDTDAVRALQTALSVPNGEPQSADTFWSDLMAGALQVRQQSGNSGQTLWFNPVFDAGLVVHWNLDAGQWQPDAAWWVLGQDIRNDAAAKEEIKTVAVADSASLFQNGEAVFRLANTPGWRPPQQSQEAGRIVRERVTAARASLDILQGSEGGSAVYWAARRLLNLGQPRAAANGPKVKPALAALGWDARQRVRVVAAYPVGPNELTLAMQSPDAPSLAVFVTASSPAASGGIVDLQLLRFNKEEDSHE